LAIPTLQGGTLPLARTTTDNHVLRAETSEVRASRAALALVLLAKAEQARPALAVSPASPATAIAEAATVENAAPAADRPTANSMLPAATGLRVPSRSGPTVRFHPTGRIALPGLFLLSVANVPTVRLALKAQAAATQASPPGDSKQRSPMENPAAGRPAAMPESPGAAASRAKNPTADSLRGKTANRSVPSTSSRETKSPSENERLRVNSNLKRVNPPDDALPQAVAALGLLEPRARANDRAARGGINRVRHNQARIVDGAIGIGEARFRQEF